VALQTVLSRQGAPAGLGSLEESSVDLELPKKVGKVQIMRGRRYE
jgi:hypothetical protein